MRTGQGPDITQDLFESALCVSPVAGLVGRIEKGISATNIGTPDDIATNSNALT